MYNPRVEACSLRLAKALEIKNMKQADLCKLANVPKSSLSLYLSGAYEPKQDRIYDMARVLDVSEAWLLGYDVPMERQISKDDVLSKYGITPISRKKIPLLGEIACGEPIYTNEDRESYTEAGTDIKADFCLRAKGDSMINARILDGDIVFIRKQPVVNNGEIAAVIVGDEATLKRVYYYPETEKLILTPENPKYEPLVYVGAELEQVRILGKAVAFQSDVV